MTTSDHYYQLCPLGDHNHHIRSLLPVLSTEKAQSPHLITTTNFVHLLNVLTNIRSIQIVLSTKIIKSLHSIRQLACQPRELNHQTNYLLASHLFSSTSQCTLNWRKYSSPSIVCYLFHIEPHLKKKYCEVISKRFW
jgi:hypothetical protein